MHRNYSFLTVLLLMCCFCSSSGYMSPGRPLPLDDAKPTDQGKALDTSMHDFMEGVFQGPYRRLKQAMANENKTNATWKVIRGETLVLAEGGNLLLLRKPKKDVEDWLKYSIASRDAGAELFKAAKKRDADGAAKAYRSMLNQCNACHKQFDNGKNQLEP